MHILAHRGYHAALPENTMDAFEAALTLGFEGIETDVRLSRDAELVLFHNRVAPNGVAVADLTHAELQQAVGYAVPRLDEALDAFSCAFWNIELKVPAAQAATIATLKRYQHSRRLLLTSFRHDVVLACAHELSIDCGFLSAHRPAALNSLAHAAFVLEKAIHLHGGMGFSWEVPLHYALREIRKFDAAFDAGALAKSVGQDFIQSV